MKNKKLLNDILKVSNKLSKRIKKLKRIINENSTNNRR